MSPRRRDPAARPALLDIAARLLTEEGPKALSARRIAAEAGSSTMALYTHFGGMNGLVRATVHEGFARLQRHFDRVHRTADPVADLAVLGFAYRCNALDNPHLYGVMFGGALLGGFSVGEEDRRHGRYTLTGVVESAARCIEAGRFRATDPGLVAHQMWSAVHGLVTLELGGYLLSPWNAESCLLAQLTALMVGVGDSPSDAAASMASALLRMPTEVASHDDGPRQDVPVDPADVGSS
ncbi:TetR/AcrR family transcriptional regulator [Streptomyces sp. SP17BM10]|uniref:TetR/AcrR family transcriptional regulator n=1 Tax=Streptomyces sp. SP17BM10 TaxID=3002530 RepID=UPI002E78244A|nr:TetR/AcrR family transcriptional regulator [Streptomyces sp. SP17BM10]MEE1784587.1 TetR/AcrR family transcriptional regulator [Streptomyces sp. SP17BM10]